MQRTTFNLSENKTGYQSRCKLKLKRAHLCHILLDVFPRFQSLVQVGIIEWQFCRPNKDPGLNTKLMWIHAVLFTKSNALYETTSIPNFAYFCHITVRV